MFSSPLVPTLVRMNLQLNAFAAHVAFLIKLHLNPKKCLRMRSNKNHVVDFRQNHWPRGKIPAELTVAINSTKISGNFGPKPGLVQGRDPFFQKFWSKTQWIGSVQPEKFRKNRSTFWGGPLFPVGPVWFLVEWIAPQNLGCVRLGNPDLEKSKSGKRISPPRNPSSGWVSIKKSKGAFDWEIRI